MTANIRSTVNSVIVDGASRDDLRPGDTVYLNAIDLSHTTYAWTIVYKPKDLDGTTPSTATLTTPNSSSSSFIVDFEGSYLIRLVVDAGSPSESTQFVRLRYLTKFGKLKLVAAGERRDSTAIIPVDIDLEGWANNQNFNLQSIQQYVKKVSTSGRVFYVDANRGIDDSNTPNDPDFAEDYADYSSIQDAISAAVSSTPTPSITNPYIIKIHPGLYVEDLTLKPHVHLLGLDSSTDVEKEKGVTIRTATAFHEMEPTAVSSDFCICDNVIFENNIDAVAEGVLNNDSDGKLILHNCNIVQNGDDLVTQGPALQLTGGSLFAQNTNIISNSNVAPGRLAYLQSGTNISSVFNHCYLRGPSVADINPTLLPTNTAKFDYCILESDYSDVSVYGLRSSSDNLELNWSRIEIKQGASTNALTIHPSGGVKGSPVSATAKFCYFDGNINFNTTGIGGSTTLNLGAVDYQSLNITGTLTNYNATVQGNTIAYDNSISGYSAENVQDMLDTVAAIFTNAGYGGTYLGLDSAYNGIIDPTTNPPTFGSGSGRTILADNGSVQIIAADPPNVSSGVNETDGSLEVEGFLKLGAIGASELELLPNPLGSGPSIVLGRLVTIGSSGYRSSPRGEIISNSTGTPLFRNFNLALLSKSSSGGGFIGSVVVQPGDALPTGGTPPDAGQVYIQAGNSHDTLGDEGNIFLSPGANLDSAVAGKTFFVNPLASTPAVLTALNTAPVAPTPVYPSGGNITFSVFGVGNITLNVSTTDDVTDVINNLNALSGISAALSGGKIEITSLGLGPNADILFAYDDQNGALNTALGDFSPTGHVTGGYTETVSVECTANNVLQVNGDLVVTGSISGSTGVTVYNRVTTSGPTYVVTATDTYIGVDTSGGSVTIELPITVATGGLNGRKIIIKDESGNASVNNIIIQVDDGTLGVIDGSLSFSLNSNYLSASLICNGQDNALNQWFII